MRRSRGCFVLSRMAPPPVLTGSRRCSPSTRRRLAEGLTETVRRPGVKPTCWPCCCARPPPPWTGCRRPASPITPSALATCSAIVAATAWCSARPGRRRRVASSRRCTNRRMPSCATAPGAARAGLRTTSMRWAWRWWCLPSAATRWPAWTTTPSSAASLNLEVSPPSPAMSGCPPLSPTSPAPCWPRTRTTGPCRRRLPAWPSPAAAR